MAIVSSGKALHSADYHKKKERRKRIWRRLILPLLIILVGLSIYVLRLPKFIISEVRVSGNEVLIAEDISSKALEILDGHYLYVVPRASALFYMYSRLGLERELLEAFPRIQTADIRFVNGHAVEINISEYAPYALYCVEIPEDLLSAECYFLNENGLIFAEAPSFSGDVYFIYTRDDAFSDPLDQEFLPKEEFRILNTFISELSQLGIDPNSFVKEGSRYNLILSSGARIYWDDDDNLSVAYGNLEALLRSDVVLLDDTFLDRVLYIDLTIDDKVFYKFKN